MKDQEKLTLAVDIDGVLAQPREDLDYSLCEPVPGAKAALTELKNRGFFIALHTGRHFNRLTETTEWLAKHGIPYDHIVMGKPTARYYIDDRAIHFDGNWPALVEKLHP